MTFLSISFLFYFLPLVLVGYFLLGAIREQWLQNLFLLLASLVFLFLQEPLYLPLLAVLSLCSYWLGRRCKTALWEGKSTGRLRFAAYAINGGVFLLFQLAAMLVALDIPVLGLEYTLFRTFLPAGIAVFTLRAISYVADIASGKSEADHSLVNVALYLCFFPQMVVGPVAPYADFRRQLTRRWDMQLFSAGVCRFVVGLGKKILISGNLAVITDQVFQRSATSDSVTQVPASLAWLGVLAFCLQIYYDLAAYTDIAIGLSNIFGFTAAENFNYPYIAGSLTAFWDRWLISIRRWHDTYIARPLNNRRDANADQMIVNVFIAFLAMGVWQRASVGIAIWAFLQVACMTVERVVTYDQRRIPGLVKHVYVAVIVLLGVVLLRYANIYHSLLFLRNLLGINRNGFFSPLALSLLKEQWVFLAAALLFIFPVAPKLRRAVESGGRTVGVVAAWAYPVLLGGVALLCLFYVARGLYVPVPYFSF